MNFDNQSEKKNYFQIHKTYYHEIPSDYHRTLKSSQ